MILVDDGAETGAGLLVGVRAARRGGATRVIVAVPVASPDALAWLRGEADEVVAVLAPEPFRGIASAYERREDVTDAEVREALAGMGSELSRA